VAGSALNGFGHAPEYLILRRYRPDLRLGNFSDHSRGQGIGDGQTVGDVNLAITTNRCPDVPTAASSQSGLAHAGQMLRDNLRDPLSLLLVQLILIVLLARIFGALFTRFGQPSVIGEMIAGIVLGPSVVGTLAPAASHFIFPAQSLGALRLLSQVGIILFMFVVGMELVGLLDDWNGWAVCLGLIAVATIGKLGGAMFTARWTGMNWPDSFALGALMNTRGLVELIVLNVGFDLGIISARVFAMTVIMALVTTFMTGPLLSLGNFLSRKGLPIAAMKQI
jgi:predicted Kef-type K+ transport protein